VDRLSKYYCQVIKNNLTRRISCLINGDYKVGEMMTNDRRVPLISATGSTRMGKIVAETVRASWKIIMELGGNNAIIVTPDADIKMTVVLFFWSGKLDNVVLRHVNYSRKYLIKMQFSCRLTNNLRKSVR
jgi:aldehyde dehydrogenase (NAD+)